MSEPWATRCAECSWQHLLVRQPTASGNLYSWGSPSAARACCGEAILWASRGISGRRHHRTGPELPLREPHGSDLSFSSSERLLFTKPHPVVRRGHQASINRALHGGLCCKTAHEQHRRQQMACAALCRHLLWRPSLTKSSNERSAAKEVCDQPTRSSRPTARR